ncbi:MAG: hypothetical protein J6S14_04860 [Clostridia bacterium]|nr:hypothetical protein [Clostridia bacterium]
MTINEMRSAVCKKAAELMKKYRYQNMTKSYAFKLAWANVKRMVAEAKRQERMIKATDLKVGDVVRCEFGDDDNIITCTVIDVKIDGYFVDTKIRYTDGREFTLCALKNDFFEKVA